MSDQVSARPWPFDRARCLSGRCATTVSADAELCDECGGPVEPLAAMPALLLADLADREAAFPLWGRPSSIGRGATGEPPPDVDVARLPNSDSVHRMHAVVDRRDRWYIRHAGRNPLVIRRSGQAIAVAPGAEAPIEHGDTIVLGRVPLRFFAS